MKDYSVCMKKEPGLGLVLSRRGNAWCLLWLIVLLCSALELSGQRLVFNRLNAEDGLSQNSVLTIVQDHQGFMWLGTSYGLNRFDGVNFKVYKNDPADKSSLTGNYILSSLRDSKNALWFGTSNGLNRYIPETDAFVPVIGGKPAAALSDHIINCLFEDSRGTIWVGTGRGLNQLIDRESLDFKKYFSQKGQPGLSGNDIRCIFEDSRRRLWIGSTTGLTRLEFGPTGISFKNFTSETTNPGGLSDNFVTAICEDRQKNLWVGTKHGGLNLFDSSTETFTHFKKGNNTHSLVHNNIRKILLDKSGSLWIGTLEGLSIFDPVSRSFVTYQHEPENPKSLSQNSLYDIFQDVNGSLWLGTYYNGVNIVYSHKTPFKVYQAGRSRYSINHNVISSVTEDESGNLWIGTEGGGFNYLNTKAGTVQNFKSETAGSSLTSNLVKGIVQEKSGNLWIGTHLGGLNYYDISSGKFEVFRHDPLDSNSLSSDNVSAVFEDSRRRLWVGTDQKGVDLLDKRTRTFRHFNAGTAAPFRLSGNFVRNFYEDAGGNLWIGTNDGLSVLRSDSSRIDVISPRAQSAPKRFPPVINCVRQDRNGIIWIGSYYGGLTRYDKTGNTFTNFTQKNGLPNDNVLGILDDERGNLWISTSNGLSRYDAARGDFKNYTVADGLPGNEFIPNTYYKNDSGELFFGSLNGLVSFFPNSIETNGFTAPVAFTNLKLFNKKVGIGTSDGLLQKNINLTRAITFTHDQNIFSIDFALLSFIKPEKNRYAYRMEGFEKNWNYIEASSVTYTNLPAGQYTFAVKGANNDGVWSQPARLTIQVLPPIWKTWWAYCMYLAAFLSIILFVTRYFYVSALLKREHELHQTKLNFFTNVSHEIRTHLTLIQGPVEKLMLVRKDDAVVHSHLNQVRKNAERLLKLVSELMDFRKAETEHLHLQVTKNNIVPFLAEIFEGFSSLSDYRHIASDFNAGASDIQVYFDVAQMEKVIFNLLSNAYKFTSEGGSVSLRVTDSKDFAEIKIEDNGIGIAPQYLSKLFMNFFQIYDHGKQNTGYGIGLALCKSIVELHKGTLTVESTEQQGDQSGRTCFTVRLFKGSQHFTPQQLKSVPTVPVAAAIIKQTIAQTRLPDRSLLAERPTILLVEDHADVRAFIAEALGGHYQIIESGNGQQGWETSVVQIPDLIISDVMMTEMDGLTFCKMIKTDERTSHIPVILLTANAGLNHQLSGLKTGAESYISKPFSIELLELTVANLLAARKAMQQKYSRQVTLQPQNVVIASMDEHFLNRIVTIAEEFMDDPGFGVPMLAEKIGMSQSVLYKKLKAVTDLSVNDLLKSIRLKRAAQLLRQQKLTIYEVAYAVGYEDRKYFSKEFKKQFGKTPSEYAAEDF